MNGALMRYTSKTDKYELQSNNDVDLKISIQNLDLLVEGILRTWLLYEFRSGQFSRIGSEAGENPCSADEHAETESKEVAKVKSLRRFGHSDSKHRNYEKHDEKHL